MTPVYRPGGMEFFGQISYIKGGIAYRRRAQHRQPHLRARDPDPRIRIRARRRSAGARRRPHRHPQRRRLPRVEPRRRPSHLPAHYSVDDLSRKAPSASATCWRSSACPRTPSGGPLIGIVSRFTPQKGTDLLADMAGRIVAEDAYLVALGSGDPEYRGSSSACWPPNTPAASPSASASITRLAHRIEAGADMFLMPSRYEPCGLNQIYSLRYGTVPVVRATGGLDDTIDEGTGFKFAEYSGAALLEAVRSAVGVTPDRDTVAGNDAPRHAARTSPGRPPPAAYSALYRQLAAGAG